MWRLLHEDEADATMPSSKEQEKRSRIIIMRGVMIRQRPGAGLSVGWIERGSGSVGAYIVGSMGGIIVPSLSCQRADRGGGGSLGVAWSRRLRILFLWL